MSQAAIQLCLVLFKVAGEENDEGAGVVAVEASELVGDGPTVGLYDHWVVPVLHDFIVLPMPGRGGYPSMRTGGMAVVGGHFRR
jgi:hypothetical protein